MTLSGKLRAADRSTSIQLSTGIHPCTRLVGDSHGGRPRGHLRLDVHEGLAELHVLLEDEVPAEEGAVVGQSKWNAPVAGED